MMKKMLAAGISMVLALSLLSISGFVGCESSSSNDDTPGDKLSISPPSISITALTATNITFTASGGSSNYTWRIDKPTLGTIVSEGNTAIYSSTTNAGVNFLTITDTATNIVSSTITHN